VPQYCEITNADYCFSRVLKELQRLQKMLEPRAPVHRDRDFQTRVREAETLIRSMPCPRDSQDDLRIAVKGIATEASQKKKPKPTLCMDDNMYL
jgi:hypothetical protein